MRAIIEMEFLFIVFVSLRFHLVLSIATFNLFGFSVDRVIRADATI